MKDGCHLYYVILRYEIQCRKCLMFLTFCDFNYRSSLYGTSAKQFCVCSFNLKSFISEMDISTKVQLFLGF